MAVSFDRIAGVYDATRWSGVPPEVMKSLLNAMKELSLGCRTILDVGIGTGRFAEYLNDSGFGGYPLDRFNDGEAGLRRAVPPATVKLVGDYWIDIDVHEEIDSFDRRKSSVSWDVPAEVNDKIIQRLHSENPEKTIRRREIVEVVGWDSAQLRNFAARERSRP